MAEQKDNKKSPTHDAFCILEDLLSKKTTKKKLKEAFEELLEEDPIAFYIKLVKPTAEKEAAAEPNKGNAGSGIEVVFSDEEPPDKIKLPPVKRSKKAKKKTKKVKKTKKGKK
jgi:hypothetical protein